MHLSCVSESQHIRCINFFFAQPLSSVLLSIFECKFSEHDNKSEWHVSFISPTLLYWFDMLVTHQTPVTDYAQPQEGQQFVSSMMVQMPRVKLKSKRRFWHNSGEKLKVSASWESCALGTSQELFTFGLVEDISYDLQKTGADSEIYTMYEHVQKLRKMDWLP